MIIAWIRSRIRQGEKKDRLTLQPSFRFRCFPWALERVQSYLRRNDWRPFPGNEVGGSDTVGHAFPARLGLRQSPMCGWLVHHGLKGWNPPTKTCFLVVFQGFQTTTPGRASFPKVWEGSRQVFVFSNHCRLQFTAGPSSMRKRPPF